MQCLIPDHDSRSCTIDCAGPAAPEHAAPPARECVGPAIRECAPVQAPPATVTRLARVPAVQGQEPARVMMAHSVEMEEAEQVLSRAMVASITSNMSRVSCAEVSDVLLNTFDLTDGDFTVHAHHPEDFLILFNTHTTRRRLDGDHFINSPRFSLSIRPWSKLAHVGSGVFEFSVELELRGIPAQARHLSTVEHILGESCWIERLHPNTRSRADMDTFRLAGRTHCSDNIRRAAVLEIVEQIPARLGSDAPTIRTLTYPISIAVARVASSRTPQLGGQPAVGNGGDGTCEGNGQNRATAAASVAVRTRNLRAALTAWLWTHPCGVLGTEPPVPMVLPSPTHGRRPPAW
uniref:Uncharacterized protein n=1 Tax=Hordeum vulgare subsp. vulgare TaxID=112509 RepID=A0A8I6W5A0_HORVV